MPILTMRVFRDRIPAHYTMARKRSPWYVVHVLRRGTLQVTMGRSKTILAQPTMWLSTPHGPSFQYLTTENECDKWYLGFSGPVIAQWEAQGLLPREFYAVPDLRAIDNRMQVLQEVAELADASAARRRALLLEELLMTMNQQCHWPLLAQDEWPIALLSLFAQEDALPPEVSALAKQHGCSVATIRRRFHAVTGQTLVQAWNDARMELAARLFLDGNDSVSAVAQRCGYADPLYFSRLFRGYYSLSPRQFVQQVISRY